MSKAMKMCTQKNLSLPAAVLSDSSVVRKAGKGSVLFDNIDFKIHLYIYNVYSNSIHTAEKMWIEPFLNQ